MRVDVRIAFLTFAALPALAHPGASVLFAAPFALLIALFALGRFPGERKVLARYRAARHVRGRRAPRRLGSSGRAPYRVTPCGSALLAFKRAVRPPPALAHAI